MRTALFKDRFMVNTNLKLKLATFIHNPETELRLRFCVRRKSKSEPSSGSFHHWSLPESRARATIYEVVNQTVATSTVLLTSPDNRPEQDEDNQPFKFVRYDSQSCQLRILTDAVSFYSSHNPSARKDGRQLYHLHSPHPTRKNNPRPHPL
jgi:hypothetical protein